jgi:hypothetical protein
MVAYHKQQGSGICLSATLPASLVLQLESLIAQILWNPQYTMPVNAIIVNELRILYDYATNRSDLRSILIGLIVPCNPYFHFTGDASQLAGGV